MPKISDKKSFDPSATVLRKLVDENKIFLGVSKNGRFHYLNQTAREMLAIDKFDEEAGLPMFQFLHEDYQEIFYLDVKDLDGEMDAIPSKLRATNGRYIDVKLWITVFEHDGEEHTLIECHDITEQLRNAEMLRTRERYLATIINTVSEGLLTLDEHGTILTFNHGAEVIFRTQAYLAVGRNIGDFIPVRQERRDGEPEILVEILKNRREKFVEGRRLDETVISLECTFSEWRRGDRSGHEGSCYTVVLRDSTEREAYENALNKHVKDLEFSRSMLEQQATETVKLADELAIQKEEAEHNRQRSEYLALHDELTELPNRRQFQRVLNERLEEAETDKKDFCLLYVDLDNFKQVNDTLGHNAGDMVLVTAAKRLTDTIRSKDFVARLGGDEFAVVTSCINGSVQSELRGMAERFHQALQIEIGDGEQRVSTSASIGAAIYPIHADNLDQLMKEADNAMYSAKRAGRNQVGFAEQEGSDDAKKESLRSNA